MSSTPALAKNAIPTRTIRTRRVAFEYAPEELPRGEDPPEEGATGHHRCARALHRDLGRDVARLRSLRTNPFLKVQVLRDLRDYNRRDFHPDDHDNKEFTEHWRAELFSAGGTLTPRLTGAAADSAG